MLFASLSGITIFSAALGVGALFKYTNLFNFSGKKTEGNVEKKEVPKTRERLLESQILRSPNLQELENPKLVEEVYPGKETMVDNFEYICKKCIHDPCYLSRRIKKEYIERDFVKNRDLVTKEFGDVETLTYGEVLNMTTSIASGLKQFISKDDEKKQTKVGIYLETRKEWMMMAHASWLNNYCVVTSYANLGLDALVTCLNETEMEVLVCNSFTIKFIDDNLFHNCKHLKKIITVGNGGYRSRHFEQKNIYDLLLDGEKNPVQLCRPSKEDTAVIMYTSGTTGKTSKGVILTHKNIVSAVAGYLSSCKVLPNDTYLSYLPLAHIYELVVHNTFFFAGAKIGFGSPRTLVAKKGGAMKKGDLETFKPSVIVGVPRIFQTIEKSILQKISDGNTMIKILFYYILNQKIKLLKQGKNETVALEKVVFDKIRKLLGGRCRLMISGGAPLSPNSHYFLQSVLGKKCIVVQGYGMTESCASCTVMDTLTWGGVSNIGYSLDCCELKLESVPELNYFADEGKGELLVHGPCVTKGYFKRPELTKELFTTTKDGKQWLKTGDICEFNKNGTISIIDRKKNLVKISQGEYVALESLEACFGESEYVQPNGLCIFANSFKSYITAVCVIQPKPCFKFAKENGFYYDGDLNKIIKDNRMRTEVMKSFNDIGIKYKKKPFEIIKKVYLTTDIWSVETEELTASSKLKRRNIQKKYQVQIDKMFETRRKKKKKNNVELFYIPKYYYQISPDWSFANID